MAEKEQNSLSFGDILDQLVKPSVVKDYPTPPTVQPKASIPQPASGFKLPELGLKKDTTSDTQTTGTSDGPSLPATLPTLLIRTMADDLARLKRGQSASGFESERSNKPTLPAPEAIKEQKGVQSKQKPAMEKPKTEVPATLKQAPQAKDKSMLPNLSLPSIFHGPDTAKTDLPALPAFDLGKVPEKEHVHESESQGKTPGNRGNIREEVHIPHGDEELLPPFPGAPVPKKLKKAQEEKVEYGLIARVIGSGMSTGILSTVAMAIIVYILLSFFVFNDNGQNNNPNPSSSEITESAKPIANELESIFSKVSIIDVELPDNKDQAVIQLRQFVDSQQIGQKEFKRIVFNANNSPEKPSFFDVMDKLGVSYPKELKDSVIKDHMALLYGQENGDLGTMASGKRLVFIVEVKDENATRAILSSWERTIPSELEDIFGLDISKQSTSEFLDNNRQGTMIRYKNFPFPDKSIDYAIIRSFSGRNYLMITNSREAMFSPTDRIKGL